MVRPAAEAAQKLRGVIAALPTPLDASGAVDRPAVTALVDWLVSKGLHGIFAGGTTGEGPLLRPDERVAVVRAAVEGAGGRIPVVAQVGEASTAATIDLARRCRDAGADALAVVTPYYFRHSDEALAAHFAAVAEAVPDRPVLLYSIPALTGHAVTPAVLDPLAQVANIMGMKDSSGDAYGLLTLVSATRPGFRLIVGADLLALQALSLGCAGMVSGPASAVPEPYVELWTAAAEGTWTRIVAAYRRIAALCQALQNGDVPRIKAALAIRGLARPDVRAPLQTLTAEETAALRQKLEEILPAHAPE